MINQNIELNFPAKSLNHCKYFFIKKKKHLNVRKEFIFAYRNSKHKL